MPDVCVANILLSSHGRSFDLQDWFVQFLDVLQQQQHDDNTTTTTHSTAAAAAAAAGSSSSTATSSTNDSILLLPSPAEVLSVTRHNSTAAADDYAEQPYDLHGSSFSSSAAQIAAISDWSAPGAWRWQYIKDFLVQHKQWAWCASPPKLSLSGSWVWYSSETSGRDASCVLGMRGSRGTDWFMHSSEGIALLRDSKQLQREMLQWLHDREAERAAGSSSSDSDSDSPEDDGDAPEGSKAAAATAAAAADSSAATAAGAVAADSVAEQQGDMLVDSDDDTAAITTAIAVAAATATADIMDVASDSEDDRQSYDGYDYHEPCAAASSNSAATAATASAEHNSECAVTVDSSAVDDSRNDAATGCNSVQQSAAAAAAAVSYSSDADCNVQAAPLAASIVDNCSDASAHNTTADQSSRAVPSTLSIVTAQHQQRQQQQWRQQQQQQQPLSPMPSVLVSPRSSRPRAAKATPNNSSSSRNTAPGSASSSRKMQSIASPSGDSAGVLQVYEVAASSRPRRSSAATPTAAAAAAAGSSSRKSNSNSKSLKRKRAAAASAPASTGKPYCGDSVLKTYEDYTLELDDDINIELEWWDTVWAFYEEKLHFKCLHAPRALDLHNEDNKYVYSRTDCTAAVDKSTGMRGVKSVDWFLGKAGGLAMLNGSEHALLRQQFVQWLRDSSAAADSDVASDVASDAELSSAMQARMTAGVSQRSAARSSGSSSRKQLKAAHKSSSSSSSSGTSSKRTAQSHNSSSTALATSAGASSGSSSGRVRSKQSQQQQQQPERSSNIVSGQVDAFAAFMDWQCIKCPRRISKSGLHTEVYHSASSGIDKDSSTGMIGEEGTDWVIGTQGVIDMVHKQKDMQVKFAEYCVAADAEWYAANGGGPETAVDSTTTATAATAGDSSSSKRARGRPSKQQQQQQQQAISIDSDSETEAEQLQHGTSSGSSKKHAAKRNAAATAATTAAAAATVANAGSRRMLQLQLQLQQQRSSSAAAATTAEETAAAELSLKMNAGDVEPFIAYINWVRERPSKRSNPMGLYTYVYYSPNSGKDPTSSTGMKGVKDTDWVLDSEAVIDMVHKRKDMQLKYAEYRAAADAEYWALNGGGPDTAVDSATTSATATAGGGSSSKRPEGRPPKHQQLQQQQAISIDSDSDAAEAVDFSSASSKKPTAAAAAAAASGATNSSSSDAAVVGTARTQQLRQQQLQQCGATVAATTAAAALSLEMKDGDVGPFMAYIDWKREKPPKRSNAMGLYTCVYYSPNSGKDPTSSTGMKGKMGTDWVLDSEAVIEMVRASTDMQKKYAEYREAADAAWYAEHGGGPDAATTAATTAGDNPTRGKQQQQQQQQQQRRVHYDADSISGEPVVTTASSFTAAAEEAGGTTTNSSNSSSSVSSEFSEQWHRFAYAVSVLELHGFVRRTATAKGNSKGRRLAILYSSCDDERTRYERLRGSDVCSELVSTSAELARPLPTDAQRFSDYVTALQRPPVHTADSALLHSASGSSDANADGQLAFSAVPTGVQTYFNCTVGRKPVAVAQAAAAVQPRTGKLRRKGGKRNKYIAAARQDRAVQEAASAKQQQQQQQQQQQRKSTSSVRFDTDSADESAAATAAGGSSSISSTASGIAVAALPWPSEAVIEAVARAQQARHFDARAVLYQELGKRFPLWQTCLQRGHSVLLHGHGSKQALLQQFAELQQLTRSGAVLHVHGYAAGASAGGVLQAIAELVRGAQHSLQRGDVVRMARAVCSAYSSALAAAATAAAAAATAAAASVAVPTEPVERRITLQSSLNTEYSSSSARQVRAQTLPHRIYLIVHSVDGEGLRSEAAQSALSLLAAHPRIHLIASCDAMHTEYQWDAGDAHRFNWIWQDATVYEPYTSELQRARSASSSRSSSGVRRKAAGSSISYTAARVVPLLTALTRNHLDVLQALATLQLAAVTNSSTTADSSGGGSSGSSRRGGVKGKASVGVHALEAAVVKKMIKAPVLAVYLKEFRDHGTITQTFDAHGTKLLHINMTVEALQELLTYNYDVLTGEAKAAVAAAADA
jgi:trimeric autotransporter adhesin